MKLLNRLATDLNDRLLYLVITAVLIYLGVMALPQLSTRTAVAVTGVGLGGYLLIRLALACWEVQQEEISNGQWIGPKYLYHTPQQVFTTEVGPADDKRGIEFTVNDAEPYSLVDFRLEHYGGKCVGYLASIYQRHIWGWRQGSRDTTYQIRLGAKREAHLVPDCPPNSDRTIIRVEMISWDIGEEWNPPKRSQVVLENSATQSCIDALRGLKGSAVRKVEITRFDKQSFPLAQAMANAFEKAEWDVDFQNGIHDVGSPHYKVGLEIIGSDDQLVEAIADAFRKSGIDEITTNSQGGWVTEGMIRIRVGLED